SSPEMLLRVTGNIVETFPIAGTRAITDDETRNEKLKQEMLNDEKELAEHTMLVDLGRNDIGRVCKYGSVYVKELMAVKKFSHVQHMVTHVVGTLNKKFDAFDAMKAVFPAGTVSGAPKIRAMEIIDELEPEARGPYAGAVGYFSFNGCCDFAIAIRTIFFEGTKGFVQTGAGIVSDSVAENEWLETQHKANAMLTALKEASK
ncbi:MAG: anthranilate synthase component I family protein, partial [Nitrosopumilaceae archaeon]